MTVERALLLAQDIVRFCVAAGIATRTGNARGGAVIFLAGVYLCPICQNFSQGEACQKCASLDQPPTASG